MTNYNPNYRLKILNAIDNVDGTIAITEFKAGAPSKIAGSKKLSFSLPAGPDFTCPGATEACSSCYAQHGRHFFPNVQAPLISNFTLFKSFEANKDISSAAAKLLDIIPIKARLFRIHESGDFYSQFVIDTWNAVVKERPNTNFWFYTRSFHLDFKSFLSNSNVTGWSSTDPYNVIRATEFAKENNIKQAYGPWDHKADLPENSFLCPVTSGKLELKAACSKCNLCVVKDRTNKNVVFLEH